MFSRILVAVSAGSINTVLGSAVEIARKHDASILALHVVDSSPCLMWPIEYDVGLVVEAMEANGRHMVSRMANVLDSHAQLAETRMVTLPLSGCSVGRAIAAAADSSDVDLILLGERNANWWNFFSENVAAQVRRHTDTPIQVVSSQLGVSPTRRAAGRFAGTPAAGAR
ncbi:universal stress protein [Paraburkholderia sp. DHOC27]|uniref:universal stress protein n=1 Tax=Paraburkholderia sp. DHOC27 TaxID=2303330 RepID=UPI000E3C05D6|nr:universal stress protein [Paraburkholderia sp. DHOC27]RFU46466.1 universal stress protein [Paraburkholderia sp. DHOC27]